MTAAGVTELSLQLPHRRLAALAFGPKDGARVLALHGWMDSAASFATLAPLLADLRVVALDLTGHGRSDWLPPGTNYQFLDWVVDVRDACDALGWDRCAILGHSLGAGLGVALAGSWPTRVTRLALIDGVSPRTQPAAEAPARLAEFVGRRDANAARETRRFDRIEAAAARLAEALDLPAAAAALLATRATRQLDDGGWTWARDPRIAVGPPLRLADAHMQAFLAAVQCPALLLRPRGGYRFPPGVLDRVAATMRALRIAEIDGGHHVHLESPAAVAAQLAPFLAG